jgi:hypothetical protein
VHALFDQVGVPGRDPASAAQAGAVLILRDVFGWSAKETAALLEGSVTSANSAYRALAISVLRIDERIAEATAFHDPGLFLAFALPTALSPTHR